MSTETNGSVPPIPAGLRTLTSDISATRSDMSVTLAELTHHVKPSELRGQIVDALESIEVRVRSAVRVELEHAKELAQQAIQETKEDFKTEVQAAYTGAMKELRAATIGRVETLATQIGDTMMKTSDTLMDTVRSNPIPAAMVGAGVVWLLMGRSQAAKAHKASPGGFKPEGPMRELTQAASTGFDKVTDKVEHVAHDAKEFAGRAATGVSQAASAVGKGVKHAAEAVGEGARMGAEKVGVAYQDTLRDRPLVLGGAALAVGIAVGLSLPRSAVEDSFMGDSRDRLLARAGEAAHEAAGSVAHLAEQSVEAASSALRPENGSP